MGCPWLWLRYACLHGSGAVLTCPRGRERYAGDSRKTRLPSQLATAELPNRTHLLPQKAGHIHVELSLHAAYYQQHAK